MRRRKILLLTGCLTLLTAVFSAVFVGCSFSNANSSTNGSVNDISHTHSLEYHEEKKATCTEDGNQEYWLCTICGNEYIDKQCINKWSNVVIPKKGHSYDKSYASDGSNHWQICLNCGESSEKVAHSGGQAACIAKAECTVCGTQYGTVDSSNHVGETEVRNAVEATADTNGYSGDIYCLDCNRKIADGQKIPATETSHTHLLTKVDRVEATCTKNGNIEYYICSGCDKLFGDETTQNEISAEDTIILAAHKLVYHDGQAASCTEGGWEAYVTCSRCDHSTYKALDALGHQFTNYVYNQDATCTQDGTLTAKCDRCEITNTVTASGTATGHTYSTVWTKDGSYHWHQATCEHTEEVGDKAPHDWNDGVITKEATETEEGEKTYTCSVCEQTKSDVIGTKTHEHRYSAEWSFDETYHWHASDCGHESEIKDRAEHIWDEGKVDLAATTYNDGILLYTCTICSVQKDEAIPALSSYTVTFYDYDGTVLSLQKIEPGKDAAAPQEPARRNYVFTSWSDQFKNVREDKAIYAQYIRQYTVTFLDGDGTVLKQETVNSGADATPPNEPNNGGAAYHFSEWDNSYKNITADTTITAVYAINTYTVKFVMPDGELISYVNENGTKINTQTVRYGASAKEPTADSVIFDWVAYKGYRFTSWDTSFDYITCDLVVTAQYLDEVTEPIIIVDSDTIERGGSTTIGVYLIGSLSMYGLSINIEYDKSLKTDKIVVGDFNIGQTATNLDTGECYYELLWSSGDALAVPTNQQQYFKLLSITFSVDKRIAYGDYEIGILDEVYLIVEVETETGTKLVRIKPVIISGKISVAQS